MFAAHYEGTPAAATHQAIAEQCASCPNQHLLLLRHVKCRARSELLEHRNHCTSNEQSCEEKNRLKVRENHPQHDCRKCASNCGLQQQYPCNRDGQENHG